MKSSSSHICSHALKQIKKDFRSFIPKDYITELMQSCERVRGFDPVSTLFCFLFQSLEGHSCKAALASFNLMKIKNGLKAVAMNTSGYCRARIKLNENLLLRLCKEAGENIEQECNAWKWKNRSVKLVDGTTLTMSDTKENQKEYPQSNRQKEGLGWPIIRLVGIFGHASGAILDFETGTYAGKGQGEPSLLKKMIKRLTEGDILILDRFFSGFFLQYDLVSHGVDSLVRIKDSVGKKHLKGQAKDVIVNLDRPNKRNNNNGMEEYDSYAMILPMRIIKSELKRKGFRTGTIYLMTSMLNKKKYGRKELEDLYSDRWGVELDFRNLKITIKADHLVCKKPEMIRKELYVKLLSYNLIRKVIAKTCVLKKKDKPRKISFKTSLVTYISTIKILGIGGISSMFDLLKGEVLNSKYRREARAIKRRRNTFPLLTVCRKEAKNEKWGYDRRRGPKGLLKLEVA